MTSSEEEVGGICKPRPPLPTPAPVEFPAPVTASPFLFIEDREISLFSSPFYRTAGPERGGGAKPGKNSPATDEHREREERGE